MRKLRFKLLMFLFCPLFFLGAMAQGTPPPGVVPVVLVVEVERTITHRDFPT